MNIDTRRRITCSEPWSGPALQFRMDSVMYWCLLFKCQQHKYTSCPRLFCIPRSVLILQCSPQNFLLKKQKVFCNGKLSFLHFNGNGKGGPHGLYENHSLASGICLLLLKNKVLPPQRLKGHTQIHHAKVKLVKINPKCVQNYSHIKKNTLLAKQGHVKSMILII